MEPTCSRCGEPLQKRGFWTIKDVKVQRWYCKKCRLFSQKTLDQGEGRIIQEVVAKILANKLKVRTA